MATLESYEEDMRIYRFEIQLYKQDFESRLKR